MFIVEMTGSFLSKKKKSLVIYMVLFSIWCITCELNSPHT